MSRSLSLVPLRPRSRSDSRRASNLDSFWERSEDLLAAFDSEGRFADVNPAWLRVLGWTPDQMLGHSVTGFIHPEDAEPAVQGGESRWLCADGSHRWLTWSTFDDGEGRCGVGRDITERTTIEAARDLAQQEAAEAYERTGLSAWRWDPASDYVALSGELESAREALGLPSTFEGVLDQIRPSHRTELRQAVQRLVDGVADSYCVRFPAMFGDQSVRWLESRGVARRDANGTLEAVHGTTQDVTEAEVTRLELLWARDFSQATLDSLDAHVAVLDQEGTIVAVNGAWERFASSNGGPGLGVNENYLEVCENAVGDAAPEAKPAARALRRMLAGSLDWYEIEYSCHSPDEERWFNMRAVPYRAGGSARVVVQHQNVTERVLAERSDRLRAHLLDEVDAAVVATDLAGRITHWNRGAERLYGWTHAEALARDGALLISPPGTVETPPMIQSRESQRHLSLCHKDGSTFTASLHSREMTDADGAPAGRIDVLVDVSERVAAEHALQSAHNHLQAVADSIGEGLLTTDTAGRVTYMNKAAEQLLGWSSEDIKGKSLHDVVHPHDSQQPRSCTEDCPIHARCDARTVRVEEDLFVCRDGRPLPVAYTASSFETDDGVEGGVVVFEDTSERKAHEEELIREAGKLKWIARIRDALAEDRFMLYAQPIVDLRSDEVIKHELLLRMRAPDGTVVPPGEYLPVAEQYGLIGDIDRWVVEQGVAIAASGSPVQINLSAQSIGDQTMLDHIEACLGKAGADRADIVFELTETAILGADEALARAFLERLRALGCTLALDDFGTGYGGFTYVKQLPVDVLKIDMQFVRDLMTSSGSRHVVKAVVSLAEDFDLKTVAEGVEDADTYDLLRDLGVDFAQGYHIARPGPLHEVLPHGLPARSSAGHRSLVVAEHPERPDDVDTLDPVLLQPESAAILVVDDDLAKRLAISSSLEPLGYPIVDVESGEEALREVAKSQFAVIIMDVRMPVMDGYETTKLIRQREDAEHTPVIFVTSHTSDELAVPTAYATGAVDFLFAPIDPKTLRAKVKVFVELFLKSRELERSLLDANVVSDGFRERELRFEAAQSLAQLGSWEWTPNGDHFKCSNELEGALARDGLERPTSLREYAALVHPDDRTGWERAVRRARAGRASESEYRIRRLDGTDRWLLGRRTLTIGPDGSERVHSSVQDISHRKAIEEQLQQTANRDPLTDLSNRRAFEYDFGRTLAYATRYERSGAVLVVDLDGFKAVNDALGHQVGDELLLGIAACLRNRLREPDLIGRLGGDEFAVVLADVTTIEAERVAEVLRTLVREQGLAASRENGVTASIGVAHFDGTADQKELLNRADQAMYEAKRDGGDRVHVERLTSA